MGMFWPGIFTAPFINASQPWYLAGSSTSTSPVQACSYSGLLQLSEASRCLHMRDEPRWGWSVPRLCFPGPRDSILQLSDSLWKLPRAWKLCLWIHYVSVSVFHGKLLLLEQNVFVEIGMICLRCLELSDTEMSSPLSVQREALIRWGVGPPLLGASWRGWMFSGGVNFFYALWTEPMEITQAEYLIWSD